MGDLNNIDISWRSALMLAVCGPLFIISVMLLFRRVEREANIWLACFLFAAGIAQIPQIIGFSGFYTVWPGLTFAPFTVTLYVGPLIYLHADRLMRGGALGSRKFLIVPGIVQTLYYSWAFLTLGDYRSKWDYNGAIHMPYVEPVETILAIGLLGLALIGVYLMIRQYRRFLDQTQSAARDFDPTWLNRLVIALSAAALVFAGLEFTPIFIQPVSYVSAFPAQIAMKMIVAWLGFEALLRTQTHFPKLSEWKNGLDQGAENSGQNWPDQGKQLRAAVISGQWYLEPRISIRQLAERMGSNETYISRALNQGLGVSFNTFINGLRIEHAKQLISKSDKSLLEIAFASGFNSKATFNRVFRTHSGATPSAFKASQNP